MAAWLVKHGLPDLEVTNVKDFAMLELWDDRCVQVLPNTGEQVGVSSRGNMKIKVRLTGPGWGGRRDEVVDAEVTAIYLENLYQSVENMHFEISPVAESHPPPPIPKMTLVDTSLPFDPEEFIAVPVKRLDTMTLSFKD